MKESEGERRRWRVSSGSERRIFTEGCRKETKEIKTDGWAEKMIKEEKGKNKQKGKKIKFERLEIINTKKASGHQTLALKSG